VGVGVGRNDGSSTVVASAAVVAVVASAFVAGAACVSGVGAKHRLSPIG
jgi:hypothetical protein